MSQILPGIALLLPMCITAISVYFAIPVFPLLAQQRKIPSLVQGLFFSLSSVPFLFVFLYLPYLQRKWGVKCTYIAHLLLASLSTLILSSLQFIHSKVAFSITCLVLQFLNGIAGSSINYLYFTISRRMYPSNFELMNELPLSLYILLYGLAPLVASQTTARFGFHVCCYIMSAFSFLILLFVLSFLPAQSCEPKQDVGPQSSDQQQQQQGSRLSYCQILKKPRVLSSTVVLFLSYFTVTYFISFLAIKLHDDFYIKKSQLGYFNLIGGLAGLVTSTPGVLLLRRCLRLTTIMAIGIVAALLGNVFMGFNPLFNIPHQIRFIYIGIFLLGMCFILISVPYIPYLVDYYQRHPQLLRGIELLRYQAQIEEITSKIVGIFTFTIGTGTMISPLIGRVLYDWVGYQRIFTIVSCFTIILGVIFLIWGGVFQKEELISVPFSQSHPHSQEENRLIMNQDK